MNIADKAVTALDLFAGTGWGVACQRLGIEEYGVEIMPEAVATREANGMKTIFNDVWDGLAGHTIVPDYDLLIASPPCQTFSVAGSGAGRAALDAVREAIAAKAYKEPSLLRAFGDEYDDRTALVLTPLAYIWRDRPRFVALEQVPTVLPVWEDYANVMRVLGYSVQTAVLSAEMFGVPQTRKRAILVASLDGDVSLPEPTHSRYYSNEPFRIDSGVKPWVSMFETLSIVATMRSNYGTGGDASKRGERKANQPAPTLTSKAGRNKWNGERNVTVREASLLQTYPKYFNWDRAGRTNAFLQIGNAVPPLLAEAVLTSLLESAAQTTTAAIAA